MPPPSADATDASRAHLESDSAGARYTRLYTEAREFFAENGPIRVAVNWNPQVPDPFQAQDDFEAFPEKDEFVLFSKFSKCIVSSTSPLVDGTFAIWFRESEIIYADRSAHSVHRLPPFDPLSERENPTLLHVEVARNLLAIHAAASFLKLIGKSGSLELDGLATQRLFDELYNYRELAGIQRVPVGAKSLLKVGPQSSTLKTWHWSAFGKPIMELTLHPISEDHAREHKSRFGWVGQPMDDIPQPSLRELLRHLQKAKLSIPIAGDGLEGSPPNLHSFPLQEVLDGTRSSNWCRLTDVSGNVKLNILIAGAPSAGSGSVIQSLEVEDDIVVATGFSESENPASVSFGYLGSNWGIEFGLPSQSGMEICEQLKTEAIIFLKAHRRNDDGRAVRRGR
jgi:hypothetical protein